MLEIRQLQVLTGNGLEQRQEQPTANETSHPGAPRAAQGADTLGRNPEGRSSEPSGKRTTRHYMALLNEEYPWEVRPRLTEECLYASHFALPKKGFDPFFYPMHPQLWYPRNKDTHIQCTDQNSQTNNRRVKAHSNQGAFFDMRDPDPGVQFRPRGPVMLVKREGRISERFLSVQWKLQG